MQTPYTFFFAFIAVLALIGLAAWLVRRFAGNRLGTNASRGRMPRLAVIDAAAVDGRRRLVLVRRDNVEHLLMIGGPTDIVVEPNIIRAMPGRDQAPPRANMGSDLSARTAPAPDAPSWADNDSSFDPEPNIPEPAPRPNRPSFIEEPRRPLPPLPERRVDPVANVPPELPNRPEPRVEPRTEPMPPRAIPRSETMMPRGESILPRSETMMPRPMRAEPPIRVAPPLRPERTAAPVVTPTPPTPPPIPVPPPAAAPAPTPPPVPVSTADQNLADMAQRLEAALRRPSTETRSEASEPRIGAPPAASEPPSRPTPRFSSDVSSAPTSRSESSAAPSMAPPIKTGFENLEDEMASLLGRPKSSS
ncbi:flagellar biosynthetic protein FliO [Tardiphaga sp.]|uniref:flagellar biosynthetic protein FliO n=1 Tax=Tardiphaga sp. TaxID=1926292 RepID=UPI0026119217|nr:flagellar biosynthetic protein FliO [Tardiphaga sp.]MDB5615825.1 hypothetical protein [Tardiphaga sp.]